MSLPLLLTRTRRRLINSLSFDGATGRVTTTVNPYSGAISAAGWAKRTDTSAAMVLIGTNTHAADGDEMLRCESGNENVTFWPSSSRANLSWTAAWPGTGVWVWWGIVYDLSNASLYINGALVSKQALAVAWAVGTTFAIGARAGTSPWKGSQAGVRLWSGAFSDAQMAAIYAGKIPRGGLLLECLFAEGAGTTTRDTSGNAVLGTLQSGATWSTDVPVGAGAV